jgi:5S rRNA maturation endonuclease (ribonuclease M5)
VSLRCPFHDDSTPSLSFNLEKGVWKCHAGCGEGGLIDFEQKLNGGSREEAGARIAELLGADHLFESQKTKPTAVYQYHDALGRLVFEKLRYEPKRFVQRRPVGNGRYEYKLDGVEKPLYHLPEVLTANEIFVCEGEKDCDNVLAAFTEKAIGIAATTNFGGAGKWSDPDSIYFAGKRVVVLADNDEPGRRHAEIVAKSVHKFATGVKVVELPGLPEKGDVSDWLANGHSTDELIAEIKKAPQWHPKETPHIMLVEACEFAAKAAPEIEWLIDGIIQKGGNGLVIADPKAGKSLLMVDLLMAVATGTRWLGFNVPRRAKCALVSREDFPGMTQNRVVRLFRGNIRPDFEGQLWINTRWQTPTFLLEDDGQVSQLIAELRAEHVEFCCFDVFRKVHQQEENDNTDMQKILDQLSRIQTEVGCAIAMIHHLSKEENGSIFRRMRGASAIHGWVEWAFGLSVTNSEEPPRDWVRKIEFETKAACPSDPIYFRIESLGDVMRLARVESPEAMRPRPVAMAASFMQRNS